MLYEHVIIINRSLRASLYLHKYIHSTAYMCYVYKKKYIHVHVYTAVLLCLVVCLTLLAFSSFVLHLSLTCIPSILSVYSIYNLNTICVSIEVGDWGCGCAG